MSLFRAGQVFGREDWSEVGRRQVLFSTERQHPDGYWPEGHGPTTGYNLVYVHAVGLYYCFSGDRAVLPALRRAAHFHAAAPNTRTANKRSARSRTTYCRFSPTGVR